MPLIVLGYCQKISENLGWKPQSSLLVTNPYHFSILSVNHKRKQMSISFLNVQVVPQSPSYIVADQLLFLLVFMFLSRFISLSYTLL